MIYSYQWGSILSSIKAMSHKRQCVTVILLQVIVFFGTVQRRVCKTLLNWQQQCIFKKIYIICLCIQLTIRVQYSQLHFIFTMNPFHRFPPQNQHLPLQLLVLWKSLVCWRARGHLHPWVNRPSTWSVLVKHKFDDSFRQQKGRDTW